MNKFTTIALSGIAAITMTACGGGGGGSAPSGGGSQPPVSGPSIIESGISTIEVDTPYRFKGETFYYQVGSECSESGRHFDSGARIKYEIYEDNTISYEYIDWDTDSSKKYQSCTLTRRFAPVEPVDGFIDASYINKYYYYDSDTKYYYSSNTLSDIRGSDEKAIEIKNDGQTLSIEYTDWNGNLAIDDQELKSIVEEIAL